jgi:hypothetical protein
VAHSTRSATGPAPTSQLQNPVSVPVFLRKCTQGALFTVSVFPFSRRDADRVTFCVWAASYAVADFTLV